MLIEMHCHSSRYSKCSVINPVELVKAIAGKSIQGLVITEHHYLWSEEDLLKLRREAEVNDNFLLLSAQEVETDIGHVLVYGAKESILEKTTLEKLKKDHPDAALIWAHPFRKGKTPQKELLNPLLDGIEVFSSNHTDKENYIGLKLWHKYKFTALSGSDTHSIDKAGIFPVQFDHPVNSINDIVREIKEKRCRPFFKEIPKSGTKLSVTEIIFGTKGNDETRNRIILKKFTDKKKWEKEKTTLDTMALIYKNGFDNNSGFRIPKTIDIDNEEQIIIEEGQRGKNLYDVLTNVSSQTSEKHLEITAQWLSKLHSIKLDKAEIQNTLKHENSRFTSYAKAFTETNNPKKSEALEIIEFIKEKETAILENRSNRFVLCHGDFHPKNIIIGQDIIHDPSTLFVSVIDFDSSLVFLPEFDIGYFLAQTESQYKKINETLFITNYLQNLDKSLKISDNTVKLFKIRANLSIASYLIRVGKGESIEVKTIIDRSLSMINKGI